MGPIVKLSYRNEEDHYLTYNEKILISKNNKQINKHTLKNRVLEGITKYSNWHIINTCQKHRFICFFFILIEIHKYLFGFLHLNVMFLRVLINHYLVFKNKIFWRTKNLKSLGILGGPYKWLAFFFYFIWKKAQPKHPSIINTISFFIIIVQSNINKKETTIFVFILS